MTVGYNMQGQQVNLDHPDLAAGYYLYDDPQDSNIPGGCGELRPGFIELGNGNRIQTCGGNLITEHLPDMVLVDDWFKQALKPMLFAAIVLALVAIYRNIA